MVSDERESGIGDVIHRLRTRLAWAIHPESDSVEMWLGELRFEIRRVADSWDEEDKELPADDYPLHDPYLASTLANNYRKLAESLSGGLFEEWSEITWKYGPGRYDDE